jgi:histidinol-phosphate aminotransferase
MPLPVPLCQLGGPSGNFRTVPVELSRAEGIRVYFIISPDIDNPEVGRDVSVAMDGQLIGRVISVGPREDFRFDTDALVAVLEERRPPLVVLTTPNNPTGRAMTIDEVRRVAEAARDGFVVVDEAYIEFGDEPSAQTLIDRFRNVLVMRTLSKGFGLAGLRVGYLLGAPEIVRELYKARIPFMVDPVAEQVACALLREEELLEERIQQLIDGRDFLYRELTNLPDVEVIPSDANFLTFKTPIEPDDLVHHMANERILIRNVSSYPELNGYVRANAGTGHENKAFVTTLKSALVHAA